ncbi:hypothetical protein [Halorussus litoreus]|uniref:hypothetical protein n=1 Tax=Halorussus litoreus TaxID=1710536 RepID=UPI0013004CC3|nr:hypothetical protein [Halorussus litoreus]
MVVYTTSDDEFASAVDRIATVRGESVVTEFESAVERDGAVVWVDSPSNFAERTLSALQRRLLDRGPEDGAFGLISGFTPADAEDLYCTRTDPSGEDVLLCSHHLDPIMPDQLPETPGLLTGDRATAKAVENRTETPIQSFQVASAGREIHISLSDGYLCGFPSSRDVEAFSGPQPFCVDDGERDCPLDGQLVPTDAIDAAHLFLLSCTTVIDNGSAGLPVHAAMGLLDGAESMIGSYRVSTSRPHELFFHNSLLQAGYDVTERCYLLNKNAHANGLMFHPYVAFGKPDAAIDDPHEPTFDVEVRAGEQLDSDVRSGDDCHVHLTDIDAHVIDFRIPQTNVPTHDDRLYVRTLNDVDEQVYYAAFEQDGDLRVLVYTGGRMQLDALELAVSAERIHHVQRQIALDSVTVLPHLDRLGFVDDAMAEQVDQFENQVRSFVKRTKDEKYKTDLDASVQQQLDSIHGHESHVREAFLSLLRENPSTPHRIYSGNVVSEDSYPVRESCPYCSDAPVFVEQLDGWSGMESRLLGSCGNCGPIFNVPANGACSDPTYPVVHCDFSGDERTQSVEIAFENDTDTPMRTTFQPVLDHMDNVAEQFFEPEREDVVLSPGESHTAEFVIDTGQIPDYRYKVRGQVVANLDLYTGNTTTVLGDKAGYYPPHLR